MALQKRKILDLLEEGGEVTDIDEAIATELIFNHTLLGRCKRILEGKEPATSKYIPDREGNEVEIKTEIYLSDLIHSTNNGKTLGQNPMLKTYYQALETFIKLAEKLGLTRNIAMKLAGNNGKYERSAID